VLDKVRLLLPKLTSKTSKVAHFVLDNPQDCIFLTTRKMARSCDVSEATVVRFAVQVGFPGYTGFIDRLREEVQANKKVTKIEDIFFSGSHPFIEELRRVAIRLGAVDTAPLMQAAKQIAQSPAVYIVSTEEYSPIAQQLERAVQHPGIHCTILDIEHVQAWKGIHSAPRQSVFIALAGDTLSPHLLRAVRLIMRNHLHLITLCTSRSTTLERNSSTFFSLAGSGNVSSVLLLTHLVHYLGNLLKETRAPQEPRELEIQKELFQGSDPTIENQEHLRIGIWGRQTSFDPYSLTSFARDLPVMECLYDGLTAYRPGTWDIVPGLAANWEVFENEKKIVFNLRQGVQFHHGYGECTSKDVAFTIKRFLYEKGTTIFKNVWQEIHRVELVDRYTITLHFTEFPLKLWDMLSSVPAFIVSHKAWKDLGEEGFKRTPVGTGSYQMQSLHFGGNTTIERFDQYWGVKPRSQYITFKGIHSESGLFHSLMGQQIDVASVPFATLSHYPKRQEINIHLAQKNDFWFMGFNTRSPLLQDVNVRKALCLSINKKRILEEAFQSLMPQAESPLPRGLPGHWAAAPPQLHDPHSARELLKAANIPLKQTLRLVFPEETASKAVARIVQENLEDMGFRVELGSFTGVQKYEQLGEQYDLFINFFHVDKFTHTPLQWFCSDSPWNLSRWHSDAYDEIINQVMKTNDGEKQHQLLIDAQKLLADAHWAVWLSHGISVVLYQKNVDIGTMQPDGNLLPWTAYKTVL
jgi:peptide/nickel transport system substrate-binding protein